MAPRPVKVRLLGLLPAVLAPCGPSCARPFVNGPAEAMSREEMDETPSHVRENGERAHAIAEQLHHDFGNSVRIEVVGLDSPMGLWLGARHRVGRGFAVIVGSQVVRDPRAYEIVRAAVAQELGGGSTAD